MINLYNGCRTVYYGEYRCTGPGSVSDGRVPWSRELTDAEAAPFASFSFMVRAGSPRCRCWKPNHGIAQAILLPP